MTIKQWKTYRRLNNIETAIEILARLKEFSDLVSEVLYNSCGEREKNLFYISANKNVANSIKYLF